MHRVQIADDFILPERLKDSPKQLGKAVHTDIEGGERDTPEKQVVVVHKLHDAAVKAAVHYVYDE